MGAWLNYDCDWRNRNLIFWGRGYSRPSNWWHESSRQRDRGHAAVWRPNNHPGVVVAYHGDRGWSGNPTVRSPAPAVTRQALARPVPQRAGPSIGVSRSVQAPVARSAPISRPASNGAFIGVHSSSVTRAYSNRGQQSMQAVTRSAPVSRLAPSSGGGRSGGSSSGHGGGAKH